MENHQSRRPGTFQDNDIGYSQQESQTQHQLMKTVAIAEMDTLPMAAIAGKTQTVPDTRGNLLLPVYHVVRVVMHRLQDPQPEAPFLYDPKTMKSSTTLGLLPILTVTNAVGLLIVSFSYYISVLGYSRAELEVFFFSGLLLMFVPTLVRLLSPAPSRLERLCLLCVLGISCYLVQFMISPLHFISYDDFMHWRTADDILRTGHFFSENPMLTVSPYYPGLEVVTNAISTITRLNTFQASIFVISAARLLMILSLFLFYEQITRSSRMAGIATAIYMTNPHFLFFDAIYNYETLSLPLAVFMLYVLARYGTTNKNYRRLIFTAWIVLMAITITHHMTDYVFVAILILWAVVRLFRSSSAILRLHLVAIALFGLLLAITYTFLFKGNPASSYLSNYYGHAFVNLQDILEGNSTARTLFATNPDISPTPIWDKLLMAASVAFVMLGLPFGLLTLWQHYRHNALAITLGIFSLAYPISQVFRFTNFGAEITDRSAAFLFLAIAYLFTIFIAHCWPTRAQKLSWRAYSFITCIVTIMFLGGVILESGPSWSNVPGPYIVVADVRSVEPEGIQAASWALSHLGPNNRIGTDRINGFLMLSYGDQRVVTGLDDKVDVSPIFYSSIFGPQKSGIVQQGKIHYLVVDQRLSTSLPLVGFYIEEGEVGSFNLTSPISRTALTKFNAIPHIDRLFDSGNIVVYDVGAIEKK